MLHEPGRHWRHRRDGVLGLAELRLLLEAGGLRLHGWVVLLHCLHGLLWLHRLERL